MSLSSKSENDDGAGGVGGCVIGDGDDNTSVDPTEWREELISSSICSYT